MYCKKCGKKLEEGDRFCSNCGAPVPVQTPVPDFMESFDVGRKEERESQRKPFHMDEMKWDLDGFPAEESPATDDIDFNWSSVLEERDNHIYRGYEEKPLPKEDYGIFDKPEDSAQEKGGSFDWNLGATMRIERPSDVVRREREEALKAEEKPEKAEEVKDETSAEAVSEPEIKDVQEEDTVPEIEELVSEQASDSSHKIDKFYTFNKKNEEFQALLDQEYERLRQRIREESEAEASFQEKYDRLQKARDDWNRQEIKNAVAEEKRAAGAGAAAGAAVGGVMAAVDRLKNRSSKADDEVDGLDDYVISDLFEDKAETKSEEEPEKTAEAEAEKSAESPEHEKETAAEAETEKADTGVQEVAEAGEKSDEEEPEADIESAEADTDNAEGETEKEEKEETAEVHAEPEESAGTEEDKEEKSEDKISEKETGTCPPSDEKKEKKDETGEEKKDDGDKKADKSKMADTAIFDDGDESDEEDAHKHKKRKALNVIIAILAIIVVVNFAMVGILMFAKDSTAAKYINDGYARVIGFFTGDKEEPADDNEPAPDEPALTGTAALIEAEKDMAPSIGKVEASADLLIPSGMEDKLSGLDGSETFVDMAWYTDDDGETVNYGNAVVGQVMSYYSGQVDSKNEESGGESVTYGINTLRIGEIRQNGVDFYVMVETEEVTSDSSDVTKGEYVVHLVAEDKKVTVSEVVDVLEEN